MRVWVVIYLHFHETTFKLNMMEISGPVEPRSTDFTRQQIMLRELRYAWERSPPDSLRMWTIDVASMFGTVLVRRGKNLVNVAQTVIKAVGKEIQSGFDAYKYDNLENHWVDRGHAISQSTSNAFWAGHDQVLALKTALQENPKENAPDRRYGSPYPAGARSPFRRGNRQRARRYRNRA